MISSLQSYFKKFISLFLIFSTLFFTENSFAQTKFSVVCPDKKIGKDDLLKIQFKVENASDVDNITPPSFDNFEIVSGPNQERSQSNINGKISGYVALGYSLRPLSTGTFRIGSATAVADGKNYKTDPVTITVVKGSVAHSQPNNNSQNASPFPNLNFDFPPAPATHQFDDYILKPGDDVEEKTAKNIFLKLDASKTTCFVGSPIVATYKLYTRLPSETTVTNAPSFNGFSVNDLQVTSDASLEKYEGRLYNVYTIRKVELYPLQAGDFTLDPVVANNQVTFVKSAYLQSQARDLFDMFQNFGSAIPSEGQVVKNVTLKSAPLVIHVKALPTENKPSDFRGAVGDFSISASLQKNNFTTDDAGTLKVTISGEGNIQLINAPAIKWPKGIDGYDAKVSDNVDKTKVPMQGSKTFSYPFTVSKAGKYVIDSISFAFFDPATSTYKTAQTAPLEVMVRKGKGIANNAFANQSSEKAEKNSFLSERAEWIGGIALVVLMILFVLFSLIKRNRNQEELEKDVKLDDLKNEIDDNKPEIRIPGNPLAAAHEKMVKQNSSEFYQTLDASLKNYLAAKFNVPLTELSKKRLNEELDKCNVGLGTSLMLTSLLNEVELNLYTPATNIVELKNVFEKASEVVSLLDKQVCKE